MIFRNATSQFLRDKSLSPILNPIFFDADDSRTLSLSATDIIDTLSLTTENLISSAFEVFENIDSIEQNINVIVSQSLNVTDSKDTIESSAENIVSAELDTTDLIDTSDISAQLDRILTLEATDGIDKAVIRANGGQSNKIPSIGTAQVWSFLKRLRKPLNAKMKVTESQDTMQAEAVLQYSAKIKASEQRDGIVFLTQNSVMTVAVISEKADATIINEPQFWIDSDKIYSDYEAHEMAIFALAS